MERMNLKVYIIFVFINILIYCFLVYWVWGDIGWLCKMGVVDMGGVSLVYFVGGVVGLVVIIMFKF